MQFIGRKLYFAWSPTMVVGLEKAAIDPGRFGLTPIPGEHVKLYNVLGILGEIVTEEIGRPAQHLWGRSIDDIFAHRDTWRLATESADAGYNFPVEFGIGRKIRLFWEGAKSQPMLLGLEKLVIDPAHFGLACAKDPSGHMDAVSLLDLYDIDGEIIEKNPRKPANPVYGKSVEAIITIYDDAWLAEQELAA